MPTAINCAADSFYHYADEDVNDFASSTQFETDGRMHFIKANLRLHQAAANSPPAIHCISYHKWPTVFTKKC